ncbi:MAG: dihydroorotate dehydrogenase electron transfer subunit [Spirochaetaceae bacterium]|jgi:NAD(P)H-flavin reductase|nr:dihydroorotate dehydrogenase electron transfer subunit [Spirochaetaceae bacterium]
MKAERQSILCRLNARRELGGGTVLLNFEWPFTPPRAGQFFMVKPARTSVFLARPLSAAVSRDGVGFLLAVRGRGTAELAAMSAGDETLLTGPLGNDWAAFLPQDAAKPVMLISGGLGIAPLAAFSAELRSASVNFVFLSGFRRGADGEAMLSALGSGADGALIVSEDGGGRPNAKRGLVTGFLDAQNYSAVFACGPEAMLKSAALLCREAGTPCFVSLEARMACGTGACLGCAVPARDGGYRRCCSDGPIFDAEDVFFEP